MHRILKLSFIIVLLSSCVRSFAPEATRSPYPTPTLYSERSVPTAEIVTLTPSTNLIIDPSLCRTTDFEISSGANTVDSQIMIGITLRNVSRKSCLITDRPHIELFDLDGKVLNIESSYAAKAEPAPLSVRAGETIVASMEWDQWCNSFSGSGIDIHLTLADGEMITRMDTLSNGQECSNTGTSSRMIISGFGYTP